MILIWIVFAVGAGVAVFFAVIWINKQRNEK